MQHIKKTIILVVIAALAAALAACGGSDNSKKLTLVAYSTPKEAYAGIIKAWQATPGGKGISVSESYGASGEQSRAVASGLPADVVNFSLEPDVTRLVKAGLVSADWTKQPHGGIVTQSVVVFLVRKGNPKGIKTWDDLVKPGVKVITPNPFISGGARWNLMAAYGAQLKQGKTPDEALAYLKSLLQNVPVQPKSAREALSVFTGGEGDVMLAYENEAILAEQKGEQVETVLPAQTILIENPAAVTSNAKNPTAAKSFLAYLWTPAAQTAFANAGYRPVDPAVAAKFSFPKPAVLFTIADLGGWDSVMKSFFDKDNGSVAKIEQDLGQSTSG